MSIHGLGQVKLPPTCPSFGDFKSVSFSSFSPEKISAEGCGQAPALKLTGSLDQARDVTLVYTRPLGGGVRNGCDLTGTVYRAIGRGGRPLAESGGPLSATQRVQLYQALKSFLSRVRLTPEVSALYQGLLSAISPVATGRAAAPGGVAAPSGLSPVRPLEIVSAPRKSDPVNLHDARVKGDVLEVDVSVSGGARPHEFGLQWSGYVLETFPPTAPLTLWHNANGDQAEAMLFRTLRFDLTPLKSSAQHGGVALSIDGLPRELMYRA